MIARKRRFDHQHLLGDERTRAPERRSVHRIQGRRKNVDQGHGDGWGRHGIRVNGIGPGYFKTELNQLSLRTKNSPSWVNGRTPLGRWGDLDELVGAAVFLASDAASFVTGHILYVDGGMTGSV